MKCAMDDEFDIQNAFTVLRLGNVRFNYLKKRKRTVLKGNLKYYSIMHVFANCIDVYFQIKSNTAGHKMASEDEVTLLFEQHAVAQVQELLNKTRADIECKKEDLRVMVG